jgi:hypothetical protein
VWLYEILNIVFWGVGGDERNTFLRIKREENVVVVVVVVVV